MAFKDDYSNLYNQASSMMFVPTPYFETPEQQMLRQFGTTDPLSVLSMMMSDASYRSSQNQPVTGLGIDGFNTSNIGLSHDIGGGGGASSGGGGTAAVADPYADVIKQMNAGPTYDPYGTDVKGNVTTIYNPENIVYGNTGIPASADTGSVVGDGSTGIVNTIKEKATDAANWISDNKIATGVGVAAGALTGNPAIGVKAADLTSGLVDKAVNLFSPSGTTATGTELSKMMTETNPYGTINWGDNSINSSIVPDVNISQPGYDNLSLTPGLSISPVGDIAQNFSNSISMPDVYNMTSPDGKNYIYSPDLGIDGSQTTPTNTIPATGNLPAVNAETVDFGLNKNPITGNPINANTGGGTVNPGGTTSPYIIPSTTDTIGGGINPNGGGITPTITGGGGGTPTVTPTTSTTPTTPISGPAVGELPQFRKQLNRALGEAKNAAIMRGTPLTENDISGAVAGLAEGAYGRLRGAQSEQNDKERLQILKDQVATAKDQWEKGFASENAYREKVLALEKYYADKGLEIDMDLIDRQDKNATTGNLIGAGYLLADLFWGD